MRILPLASVLSQIALEAKKKPGPQYRWSRAQGRKLDKNLSGVRGMRKPPGLLIIVDPSKESIAVAEAKKLNIPVMGLVDTNCNPDPIDYVIPCNDDAQRSIKLILETLTSAIIDIKNEMRMLSKDGDDKEEAEEESKEEAEEAAAEEWKEQSQ